MLLIFLKNFLVHKLRAQAGLEGTTIPPDGRLCNLENSCDCKELGDVSSCWSVLAVLEPAGLKMGK